MTTPPVTAFRDVPVAVRGTPTDGQVLQFDSAILAWVPATPASGITVSVTDRVLGRYSSGGGAVEEIACTAAGRALIDDADAATQRATLGIGSTTVAAETTVPVSKGGTGQTTKTAAFDALAPTVSAGALQVFDGTHWIGLAAGSVGDRLVIGVDGLPVWETP